MLVEQRVVVAMLIALGVGAAGVHTYPVDRGNVYLQIIELRNTAAFLVLVYGYATLWFTSTFFAASMLGSLLVDSSGSMVLTGKRERSLLATHLLTSGFGQDDAATVFSFDSRVRRLTVIRFSRSLPRTPST